MPVLEYQAHGNINPYRTVRGLDFNSEEQVIKFETVSFIWVHPSLLTYNHGTELRELKFSFPWLTLNLKRILAEKQFQIYLMALFT